MSFCNYHHLILSFLLFLVLGVNNAVPEPEEYKTYIVHIDPSLKPSSFLTHETWHWTILRSLSKPVHDKDMLLYSYNYVMHGFSARLTPSQASEIKKSPAHITMHEEKPGELFTTHSPQFMGLRHSSGLWNASSYGEGVIIGMIDSGVWPESESFNEKECQQFLLDGGQVLRVSQTRQTIHRETIWDTEHTSSTAAGNRVPGASQFGYAQGLARGLAPGAHVAMYKVSSAGFVAESDVLAAMDQAIADGVNIMSLSLGFPQTAYFEDVIAIASLSAIEKGIVVVCAAGNDGAPNTTHNSAPWITTVGAGTLDRSFIATVTLGNNQTFEGKSQFPNRVLVIDTPLYYGKGDSDKAICNTGSLSENEVSGKVVICDSNHTINVFEQAEELSRNGAAAGILILDSTPDGISELSTPSLILPSSSGVLIKTPQVAYFSSRGPDPINPNILKPDVIAPGVDVLAAIPPIIPVQNIDNYQLASDYALYSGTSMAAPHVAGVTALLKAVHPEWSPAAIRSALMTTAYNIDNNGTILTDQSTNLPGTPLDYGAGHINPNKAMNPGLIYDIDWQGYVDFLCGLGYSDAEMKAILRQSQWNCSQEHTDINYPSFVAMFNASSPSVKNFTRVVTNVGDDQSVYHAVVETTYGMTFTVEPNTLAFTNKYQKQNFVVSVQAYGKAPPVTYGYLKWIDQNDHIVASPVVPGSHLISYDELMTATYNINNNETALTNQLHVIQGTPLDIIDIEFQDYIDFLCSLGYNDAQMRDLLRPLDEVNGMQLREKC
ncbi:putative Subtilisin-like serine protease 2 [Hibiscus syriacus]|uniref:Subtilisin-like serine protease 2 n=1 Tax=Hibiscus syriacus TaxID=106335 RepID=A0A6A2YER9_HIBSY|nr:putative Subtilisin-like serine protease 2 [Hibiscus syriacus]